MVVFRHVNVRTSGTCVSNYRNRIKVSVGNSMYIFAYARAIIITWGTCMKRLRFIGCIPRPCRFFYSTRVKLISSIGSGICIAANVRNFCGVFNEIMPSLNVASRNGTSYFFTLRFIFCRLSIFINRFSFSYGVCVM